MRNARALLVLVLLATAAFAAYFFYSVGPADRDAMRKDAALPSAGAEAPSGDAADSPEAVDANAPRPTFDVVRVERNGSVVMAGQAEPGATVIVRSGAEEIGRAVADNNGEWVLQQDRTLDRREHSIELSAQSPGGGTMLYSRQRLALSLSDPKEGEPLVALTEEGRATRILQMPTPEMLGRLASADSDEKSEVSAAASALAAVAAEDGEGAAEQTPRAPVIGFASVDYEDAEQKSMIFINGVGTPGSRVAIYVDNIFAGFVVADATGSWSFSDNRQLQGGSHILRADVLDRETSAVLARAEVNFEREPSSPGNQALFDLGSKTASEPDGAAAAVSSTSSENPKTVIVKRGDTLWQIAEQFYGDGARYTQIFQNNRDQIRNPHRIYPDQRFVVPGDTPTVSR